MERLAAAMLAWMLASLLALWLVQTSLVALALASVLVSRQAPASRVLHALMLSAGAWEMGPVMLCHAVAHALWEASVLTSVLASGLAPMPVAAGLRMPVSWAVWSSVRPATQATA